MPTVTISTTPAKYSPIYPNIYFGTTSGSSSVADFKYIYRLNVLDLYTSNVITSTTYQIPPRPNGQGLFSPSATLKAETSYEVYPNTYGPVAVTTTVVPYSITYGFQYNPGLSFIDIDSQSTSSAWLKFNSFQDLQVGDILNLVMNNQTVNYGYNGECVVLQFATSFGLFYYKINKSFVSASLPQSGVVTSQRRLGATSSIYYGYDGTRQYSEINTNFGQDRVFDNVTPYQYALTNYHDHILPPDISQLNTNGSNCKKIFRYQNETLSIMSSPTFSGVQRYRFYDSNLNLLHTSTQSLLTGSIRYEVPVGTKNILAGSIVGSVSNTKFYSYEVVASSITGYTYSSTGVTYSIDGGFYDGGYGGFILSSTGPHVSDSFIYSIVNASSLCIPNTGEGTITLDYGAGSYLTDLIACDPGFAPLLNGVLTMANRIPIYTDITKFIKFYEIVDNCSPYDNFRLLFQNRHGGTDYWNFNWKHTNTLTVNRNEWRKQLAYNYAVGDRQDSILSTKANEVWDISTDWVTEYDMNFLKELLTSKEVYLYDDDINQKYPIIVLTTNWQVKTTIDNKLFACSISFRMAYDITLQN